MLYMYCHSCRRITEGKKTGAFGGNLTCSVCGVSVKTNRYERHVCEHCNSPLYALKPVHVFPECPCRTKEIPATPESVPFAEQAPPAYPTISCPYCSAFLDSEDGTYGPCPVCQQSPTPQYVSQQLYFKSSKGNPIEIKWNPGPDDLVYVHHHATHIPANSLLIVNPGQTAVYVSGGQQVALETGQTYALFDEDQDIGTIARAVNDNQPVRPSLGLKLNTKILFFDNRLHELTVPIRIRLMSGAWSIELSASLFFQINNVQTLLCHALNFNDAPSVSSYLQSKINEIVSNLAAERLVQISQERSDEWGDEQSALSDIAGTLNPVMSDLQVLANRRLADFGLLIHQISMQYRRAIRIPG